MVPEEEKHELPASLALIIGAAGTLFVVVGAALIAWPAGLIALGVSLVLFALFAVEP